MNSTIWKFELELGTTYVKMPLAAKVLCCQQQHDDTCIWVQCDPKADLEIRKFSVIVTGGNLTGNEKYIGTFQDGRYVGHVFEIVE